MTIADEISKMMDCDAVSLSFGLLLGITLKYDALFKGCAINNSDYEGTKFLFS